MATAKDIDLTEDFDLIITGGDFKVSASDQNHIAVIIKTFIGGFKQFPLVGVGADFYISSAGQESILKRNIEVQLKTDSYTDVEVDVVGQDYYVNAERIQDA